MIRIGKTLRLETVAEGVERVEQADRLRNLNCDIGQGYLFSRPLPSDAITGMLRERAANGLRARTRPESPCEGRHVAWRWPDTRQGCSLAAWRRGLAWSRDFNVSIRRQASSMRDSATSPRATASDRMRIISSARSSQ